MNKKYKKNDIGSITDSGMVDSKSAPIIYTYIYERESEDVQRFLENYKNKTIEKESERISGFSVVNGKIVPKTENN